MPSCASMGPRPFGHGNRRTPLVSEAYNSSASMGPRPFGHGNSTVVPSGLVRMTSLQWGHVLSDMETGVVTPYIRPLKLASMGPRPFGHGN